MSECPNTQLSGAVKYGRSGESLAGNSIETPGEWTRDEDTGHREVLSLGQPAGLSRVRSSLTLWTVTVGDDCRRTGWEEDVTSALRQEDKRADVAEGSPWGQDGSWRSLCSNPPRRQALSP